jgi:peptidoglycan/xylan/chitin deacetylase (PgdA/CDA1 family)
MAGNSLDGNSLDARPVVYLTFDDGPSENHGTENVLNVLSRLSLKATFFLNLANAKSKPKSQQKFIQRMVAEGHVIGNHGYKHADQADKAYYGKTNISTIEDDIIKNELEMEKLQLAGNYSCPEMKIARLQGDGRLMPQFVSMITGELKMTHAGWNVEFYPNGTFDRGKKDWMDIKGVTADIVHPIRDQDVILMHDRHWGNKMETLAELLSFLSSRYTVKPLTKDCGTSTVVRRPK